MNNNAAVFSPAEYDSKIKCALPYYEEFYRQVIDVVRIYNKNALTWLDVGCGTGKMVKKCFHLCKS